MKKRGILHNAQQGHDVWQRWWPEIKAHLTLTGNRLRIEIKPEARSLDQNALIHPVVEEIAEALNRPTDKEALRQLRYLLLEQWMHETGRPPMFQRSYDGLRWVAVNKGTSDLDKPDCSEFIEFLLATKADVCPLVAHETAA